MSDSLNKKAIVTIAIGDEYFVYALNQYLTFCYFNQNSAIDYVIITNSTLPHKYNSQNNLFIITVDTFLNSDEILLYKIFIPDFVNYEQVIYLDADNFVAGSMDILFQDFEKYSFVIFGDIATNTNWRYNVADLIDEFKVKSIYRINGCLFYYNRNKTGVLEMFNFLKELMARYDDLNLTRIYNNLKDDEVLLSIGCSKYNFTCLENRGIYKAETMYYSNRKIILNRGEVFLWNTNKTFNVHNFGMPHKVNPLIVAFDRNSRNSFDYKLNIKNLKALNINLFLFRLLATNVLQFLLISTYYFYAVKNSIHAYKQKII